MQDIRMKIAATATLLGLGGLGGYALTSNGSAPADAGATTAATSKPKVHTQVIRRTIHVRPDHPAAIAAAPPASGSAPAAAPAVSTPAPTPAPPATTPVSAPSPEPVATRTSGGPAGSAGSDEAENEVEHEGADEADD